MYGTKKKALALTASLSTIFVVLYWKHRHSRSAEEVTNKERRSVRREARRAARKVVNGTPHASFSTLIVKVQSKVMALLRKNVEPD